MIRKSNRIPEFVLGWSPLALCLFCLIIFSIRNEFYYNVLTCEDGIIEWMTVFFGLWAGSITALLAFRIFKQKRFSIDIPILCLYTMACIFFAGEEISWGQRIIGLKTVDVSPWLAEANRQAEVNIHNIKGLSNIIRILSDVFSLSWGILLPLIYTSKPFPIRSLDPYISPKWLIPGYATALSITWPLKISEAIFGEIEWVEHIRFGELKETAFALIVLLYACHLYRTFRNMDSEANLST